MTQPSGRDHRIQRMTGRDPDQTHRASTPLELLFDLTLVVTFSQAGTQMAHLLELGHIAAAVGAFAFSLFAICWAWINYSWLASAYDNDDIFFRVATMVQMLGVLVMALGMPALFHSIDEGLHVDNGIVVAGYVVMRVSTIALWLRAGRHDPRRRPATQTYAGLIALAQVAWVIQIFIYPPLPVTVAVTVALVTFEMAIPAIAERRARTPWHAHHIAERYSLLVIITLGEVILGTILAISAVVEEQGWSVEAVLVASGGVMLAFGLWWVYFTMPSGEILAAHRRRGFPWGYGHMVLFGSLAATGAGLHVAANVIEHEAHLGPVGAILTVVVPVAVFTVALITLYSLLLLQFDPFHTWLVVGALAVLTAAVLAVAAGASIGTGILLAAGAPLVVIVGYETVGHRHQAVAVERALP
ncbi:low temperature requirement protein A [Ornithinimicrobium cavernae]|uniref:low temperature requirement protein A n=1 Tax=Ornithinimicrobium cavernae TaxID=2666047 RepID=UPI000D699D31|nr:low temperature requirement protein A [Ornithinimicrobium cavernae]